MDLQFYRESVQQHGVGSTLMYAAYRAANQLAKVAYWNALAVTLDRVDPSIVEAVPGANSKMLKAEQLLPCVDDPESHLTREGLKGIVSYVDATNFASLKSCYRMGYQTFGPLAVLKIGGRFVCRATPSCKAHDFRVAAF